MAIVIVMFVMFFARDNDRTAACEAHGWERAQVRGGLCVDSNGVVRAP